MPHWRKQIQQKQSEIFFFASLLFNAHVKTKYPLFLQVHLNHKQIQYSYSSQKNL